MAISTEMKTHLAAAATYLCHCWRIEERLRECVVHWSATGKANVIARGGYLKKNAGSTTADDAGARSIGAFNGDMYVKFRTRLDGTVYFGLATNNALVAASSINFAIRVEANGTIKIYEAGVLKTTSATTAKKGDFLRVQRVGTTITYWHNRTKIYTSLTATSSALYCDTSLVTTGATVNEAVFGYPPQVITVTDHTRRITFNGEVYKPLPIMATQYVRSAGLRPGNAELTYIFSAGGVTTADARGGRWDYARFEFFAVNYLDLTMGVAQRMVGDFGEIKYNHGRFTAELRSLAQPLSQEIGSVVGALCIARQFGDFECGQPLDNYTHDGFIDTVNNKLSLTVSLVAGTKADAYFEHGLIRFRTGNNKFFEREIKNNDGDVLTLQRPFPILPVAGDFITVIAGCNRTAAKCKTFVNPNTPSGTNIENLAGAFPYVPGNGKVFQFPE